MGYYCTVPQCTSLAGKTKNVKFHRFPRDTTMADKWNVILKRGKPYTKYSKVCSLHFTQSDYNVTNMAKSFEPPKDYTKSTEDYIPQTNEEYNKEAEKYALGRKSHNGYDKLEYQKPLEYQKMGDFAEILRNQQHNLQILQEQHRATENQNFFPEGHIKQEVDLNGEEEKFLYERTKDQLDAGMYAETQRRLVPPLPSQVKQEPEGCENVMQPQGSPYYSNGHDNVQGQNTMKRPFFYSENPHYNGPPLLHRFEDIPRILQ
ncbi:hypothetical protein MSG28_015342 [Choristoneura fumiferana]|uniref:Uncharacterized protein n=1 Tax=Choristoneura fumiferana TaxID=7141 RepID=A0ACC0KAH0_CHOFU|nr:hypothetical protein MSG28_015342 [Choristoneura fumiferana]